MCYNPFTPTTLLQWLKLNNLNINNVYESKFTIYVICHSQLDSKFNSDLKRLAKSTRYHPLKKILPNADGSQNLPRELSVTTSEWLLLPLARRCQWYTWQYLFICSRIIKNWTKHAGHALTLALFPWTIGVGQSVGMDMLHMHIMKWEEHWKPSPLPTVESEIG